LSITMTRLVGGGGSMAVKRWNLTRLPATEMLLQPRHRLVWSDVADDGDEGVVGDVIGFVEVDEILPRQARQRFRSAASRQSVGMETIDQAIDDTAGDRFRIVSGHLQRRQRLLPLTLDLDLRERRPLNDIGHQFQRQVVSCPSSRPIHKLRSLPAPVPSAPPTKSIVSASARRSDYRAPDRAVWP
jgi:hypothetical protein